MRIFHMLNPGMKDRWGGGTNSARLGPDMVSPLQQVFQGYKWPLGAQSVSTARDTLQCKLDESTEQQGISQWFE